MRKHKKLLAALGIVLAVVAIVLLVVRTWVVKAMIVGQIQARVGGKVEVRDWWLNGRDAGVIGLKVHEGPETSSPVWASAERVSTDLTLGSVLHGRLTPGRVTLEGPEVTLKFDEAGKLRTKIAAEPAGETGAKPGPVPVVIADGAKVTLRQAGRPAMVVTGVTARLGPDNDRLILSARSNDPDWGPFEAHGEVNRAFRAGNFDLKTMGTLHASPEKARSIPFVPPEVWKNVAPDGEVDIALKVVFNRAAVHVHTEVGFHGTAVRSETLELSATKATGRLIVDDAVVTFRDVSGESIGGRVTANGTADFSRSPSRFDLGLDLKHINIADTPKSWQLDEVGITGHLTGKARLVALVGPKGVNLSGTSGDAVVEEGAIQGIPFKSMTLVMNASGNDLRYDAGKQQKTSSNPGALRAPSRWLAILAAVAVQAPDGAPEKKKAEAPKDEPEKKPGITLPKSITTHLELDDVDLSQLIAKAKFLLGYPFPVPISGRLTLKADATIPLGKMRSIADYVFHGDLVLTKASAYKVDLGRVSARIDLSGGVLELKDFRGRLVNHPDGGPDNPPKVDVGDVPATGPLPPGAFRGNLSAALSPPGKLTARFEGNQLPLGELSAPALPRPTPLAGLATLNVQAEADFGAAGDPAARVVAGTAQSQQITYKGAALDAFATRFALKNGRLDVPELTALLRERPLRAKVGLDLKPPHAFQGVVNIAGWDLAEILAWAPAAPKPAPVAGTLSARAEASGTLQPLAITTDGHGSFERFQAGPVALGAVPFQWTTKDDIVTLAVTDARPFGGRLAAEANVPLTGGRPIDGSATIDSIDTAALSAAIPGGNLKLTGRASGKVKFSVPSNVSALDASVKLTAPDLTIQGLPAEQVKASVRAQKGALGYEVSADSLGGVIRLKGEFPLGAVPARHRADAELRAVGFTLDRVWQTLGTSGPVTRLAGRGAIDTNLRAILDGPSPGLYAHGIAELRDLRWGGSGAEPVSLGGLRGTMMMTPAGWRIDPIDGDLLGGVASGTLWGSGPTTAAPNNGNGTAPAGRQLGFNLRIDRAELSDAAEFLHLKALKVEGFGVLRLAGLLGETLSATGDLHVPGARIGGLPVTELKVPAVFSTAAGSGAGVLRVHHYAARVAGGNVHGDALVHTGATRAFQGDLVLTDVDLESIARIESEARRPASGKISGRVTLHGHDIESTRSYRGQVNLSLDDASLVALPVFRELDKLLGSARGGVFEAGDLAGTIANRELIIESATLEGRLAQLHISGTVGFDGLLDLEVLVNTNQLIPQAGSALASAIPGLRGGGNAQATLQVTNYLSNRLLKLRVTGTLKNPSVNMDPGVAVAGPAVGFFSGVLKLPLGLAK